MYISFLVGIFQNLLNEFLGSVEDTNLFLDMKLKLVAINKSIFETSFIERSFNLSGGI